MNKQTMFTIAKREFASFINSPLSFVITVPFLLISMFVYFRTSLVSGEATLRPYFDILPWFLLFLAPALSMKLLTDERKTGTIDLLFAHPITETEIVIGKFLGAFFFFLAILATTLLLPVTLLFVANPDPGIIITQYIGGIFVGATFLSIGLLCSTYVANAIGSFLLAVSIGFALILIGLDFVTLTVPWPFSRILEEAAILPHMTNIARGLLDIRDVLYFVTVSGLFLAATVMKLSERKIHESRREKRKLTLALVLILGIGIALNVVMSIYPFRLDLTQQHLFSLSEGTKQTLKKLPDIVTVTVFSSRDLPGQMQLTSKEVTDLLRDYQRYGNRLNVKTVYPDTDPQAAADARQQGVQEVSFNKIGSGQFQVQTGFMGLSIRYADKTEVIPFIQDTSDLEYQLTRRIRKLTQSNETKIAIYKNSLANNQALSQLIGAQYTVSDLSITDLQDPAKRKGYRELIVIDDGASASSASAAIKSYLDEGGNVLYLANGVSVNQQSLTVTKSQSTLSSFLNEYGVTLNQNLIYDLQLNETLTFNGANNMRYLSPYPFWIRSLPQQDTSFAPIAGLKSISLPWPSSLTVTQKSGIQYKNILATSKTGGILTDNFKISPNDINSLPSPSGQNIILGESIEKGNTRIIVLGNANLVDDQFIQNFQENVAFLANSIDYLASDKDLAAIPKKTSGRSVYIFTGSYGPMIFQYSNILIPPILVALFALYWLTRRKRLTNRHYHYEN
jgi:ABC-2 type transport system permease protein